MGRADLHYTHLLLVLALPAVLSLGGGALLERLSGRERVKAVMAAEDRAVARPLNSRLRYDAAAATAHWTPMKRAGVIDAEIRFLELDLIFPFVYGGGFLSALLIGWAACGRPWARGWLVLPVAATVMSDWTENLLLLPQIRAFAAAGPPAVDAVRIGMASLATGIKNVSLGVLVVVTLAVAAAMLRRRRRPLPLTSPRR